MAQQVQAPEAKPKERSSMLQTREVETHPTHPANSSLHPVRSVAHMHHGRPHGRTVDWLSTAPHVLWHTVHPQKQIKMQIKKGAYRAGHCGTCH